MRTLLSLSLTLLLTGCGSAPSGSTAGDAGSQLDASRDAARADGPSIDAHDAAPADGRGEATAPTDGNAPPTGSAALLSYIRGLSSKTGRHVLSGQHSNYWDSNPMDQFAGSIPSATIGSTGLTPAILGTTLSESEIPLGLAGSAEDGVSLSNAWLAAGGIVHVSLWPGNPQTGGSQDDVTLSASELLMPGTASYKSWQTYLAAVAKQLTQIKGPLLLRPFIELNGGWFWWGVENFTSAQFIQLWQGMHDYIVGQGVTNVLWVYNVNTGQGNYTSYYPGDTYVDVVSMDSYPPTSGDASMYTDLQTLGKPIIYSEIGVEQAQPQPATFSGDYNAIREMIEASFPDVVGTVVWCQNWALSEQNGAAGFLGDPSIVNLTDLPSGP
jgi:mannan endo-1,4-beta-mannosidase